MVWRLPGEGSDKVIVGNYGLKNTARSRNKAFRGLATTRKRSRHTQEERMRRLPQ